MKGPDAMPDEGEVSPLSIGMLDSSPGEIFLDSGTVALVEVVVENAEISSAAVILLLVAPPSF